MTLNGVIALILLFSPNSIALHLQAYIMSKWLIIGLYCLQLEYRLPLFFQNWTTLQRGISAIAELLYCYLQ